MALVRSVLSVWRYSGRQVSIILMDHIALDTSVSQSLRCRIKEADADLILGMKIFNFYFFSLR